MIIEKENCHWSLKLNNTLSFTYPMSFLFPLGEGLWNLVFS